MVAKLNKEIKRLENKNTAYENNSNNNKIVIKMKLKLNNDAMRYNTKRKHTVWKFVNNKTVFEIDTDEIKERKKVKKTPRMNKFLFIRNKQINKNEIN